MEIDFKIKMVSFKKHHGFYLCNTRCLISERPILTPGVVLGFGQRALPIPPMFFKHVIRRENSILKPGNAIQNSKPPEINENKFRDRSQNNISEGGL